MARRILVVDDEKLSRLATQKILEKLGFQVLTADDGRGAVVAEAKGGIDVIIMDCQMPHMDGFQATATIRRREGAGDGDRTLIIGLSARDMEGDREMAIARGMDAYITKPVNVRKVQAALQEVGIDGGGRPAAP